MDKESHIKSDRTEKGVGMEMEVKKKKARGSMCSDLFFSAEEYVSQQIRRWMMLVEVLDDFKIL